MFIFFKQKTEYEMRSSDWSSDVCSSDLRHAQVTRVVVQRGAAEAEHGEDVVAGQRHRRGSRVDVLHLQPRRATAGHRLQWPAHVLPVCRVSPSKPTRSEEHTSELQSLMRISYAVFCLKKKTTTR